RLLKSAGLAPEHQPEEELEDELEMRALVERGSRLVATALQASAPIQDRTQSELKSRAAWSVAASSLRSKGELLGVMAVATRQPRVFSQPEMEFVAAVAEHLAVALERAREHSREARTDHLTGLANRPEFERSMERAIAAAERHRRPLTLMLVDLDNLKDINDSYGHQAGDEAIRTVARGLHAAVRASDTCARVGGDEFALAMPEADLRQAYDVAERVRRALEAVNTGARIRVDFSLGLAAWEPGLDWSHMFRLADQRLYRDKKRHHSRERSAGRA
ncbi:MAG TPA: sensor domain-containing diguanylate cyclase, partial [Candidatus Acidoferrales bacterium]|nr:sensor domain-containing diguanylate cyclase [Candidatus Acidoferrales bacterium]